MTGSRPDGSTRASHPGAHTRSSALTGPCATGDRTRDRDGTQRNLEADVGTTTATETLTYDVFVNAPPGTITAVTDAGGIPGCTI